MSERLLVGQLVTHPDRVAEVTVSAEHFSGPRCDLFRAIQRLVVGSVARKDQDRVDLSGELGGELGRVAGLLRKRGLQVDALAERALDGCDPLAGDVRGVRVDD